MAEAKAPEGSEAEVQGPKPENVVARWLRELKSADTHEETWRTRAAKIVKLYKDERAKVEEDNSAARRFNILYANTEVLKGTLYSRCPTPDIRRRWQDKDPVGRVASLVLTRCVTTALDQADMHGVMKDSVFDMVLPGRGQARVRYVPTFEKLDKRVDLPALAEGETVPEGVQMDDKGYFRTEQVEEVTYECIELDYVDWELYRVSPAKRWPKVRWEAFGELLTRDDCIREFGEEIGSKVDLTWKPAGMEDTQENAIFKRALVWTIWNKTERKCIVVSDGYKEAPLKEADDPLRLQGFFPSPRPLYAISTTDSMVPTPEYAVYQDHARDLDALEERISVLTDALRRRGVFDGSVQELRQLADATKDNDFVAIKDWKKFAEKGGLANSIEEMDNSGLAQVLVQLMQQAEIKKQQIYEIIGINDIMRGATKASETATAQRAKSEWGSVRIGPRQEEVQRFARDIVRLVAEIIAEHFSPKTMAEMSGIELALNDAEKQQRSAVNPQDPTLKRPTWEQVLAVLRDDKLRSFKIDIETDSTIKPRADEEQKNRIEAISALTGAMKEFVPAVQAGVMPKKVATEVLMFGLRAFQAGSQLEELLDEWASGGADEVMGGQGQPQQDPQAAQQAMQAQEMQKQAQHADGMRQAELEAKQADAARAKAQAHEAIAKAEIAKPSAELDLLKKKISVAAAEKSLHEPQGAPAGATVQ